VHIVYDPLAAPTMPRIRRPGAPAWTGLRDRRFASDVGPRRAYSGGIGVEVSFDPVAEIGMMFMSGIVGCREQLGVSPRTANVF
jgi:hypothetical protein